MLLTEGPCERVRIKYNNWYTDAQKFISYLHKHGDLWTYSKLSLKDLGKISPTTHVLKLLLGPRSKLTKNTLLQVGINVWFNNKLNDQLNGGKADLDRMLLQVVDHDEILLFCIHPEEKPECRVLIEHFKALETAAEQFVTAVAPAYKWFLNWMRFVYSWEEEDALNVFFNVYVVEMMQEHGLPQPTGVLGRAYLRDACEILSAELERVRRITKAGIPMWNVAVAYAETITAFEDKLKWSALGDPNLKTLGHPLPLPDFLAATANLRDFTEEQLRRLGHNLWLLKVLVHIGGQCLGLELTEALQNCILMYDLPQDLTECCQQIQTALNEQYRLIDETRESIQSKKTLWLLSGIKKELDKTKYHLPENIIIHAFFNAELCDHIRTHCTQTEECKARLCDFYGKRGGLHDIGLKVQRWLNKYKEAVSKQQKPPFEMKRKRQEDELTKVDDLVSKRQSR